jgi:hypothetical protein
MTVRKTLTATAALSLLFGIPAASAAVKKPPKPVCNLVKDAKGDATDNGTNAVAMPNDPNLDIVTADVASNANTVTGVIRLAALDGQGSTAPTGAAYTLSFLVKGTVVVLRAYVSPAGESFADGTGKALTGKVDKAKKEIRIHAPIASLPVQFKAKDKVTEIKAQSARWVASSPVSLGLVDNGISPTTYSAGALSCVKVGA